MSNYSQEANRILKAQQLRPAPLAMEVRHSNPLQIALMGDFYP
jgi:hypothetical protein